MFFVPNLYSSNIKDGIWKVIHKLVAQVINQRKDKARLISGEDIDMMIYIKRGVPIDFMEVMTKQFTSYKSSESGHTGIGGGYFVTLLAKHFGFGVKHLSRGKPAKRLNIEHMVAQKMLAGDTLKWMEHVEILPELRHAQRGSSGNLSTPMNASQGHLRGKERGR
ncbi:hypothetical protein QQ045_008674 [Rhodiola kirilowii]